MISKNSLSLVTERPYELGEAYFYKKGELIDVDPFLNHRDWALNHYGNCQKTTDALDKCYQDQMLRLVWSQLKPKTATLYINGTAPVVWREMRNIMSEPRWQDMNCCVIEYLTHLDSGPCWYKTEVYGPLSLEYLAKGRRPSVYLQQNTRPDPKIIAPNRLMNDLNDNQQENLLEMFNAHILSSNFFDIDQQLPQNKYILQRTNDLVYM